MLCYRVKSHVLPHICIYIYISLRVANFHSDEARRIWFTPRWPDSMFQIPTCISYVGVAAGWYHTVLLRSDGAAVAFGANLSGQTDVPDLAEGMQYVGVAAGAFYTVLLRSDRVAVAFNERAGSLLAAVS